MLQRSLDGTNYLDTILARLADARHRDVLVQGDNRVSGEQALDLLWHLADGLRARGLCAGDGVAVFIGNSPEGILLCLAVHLAGCRLVFVPPEPGNSELQAFLRHAEVRALVCDSQFAERALPLAAAVPVEIVLTLGPSIVDDLLAGPIATARHHTGPIATDQLFTLLYTGGTTGRPKLVVHDHQTYHAFFEDDATAQFATVLGNRMLVNTLITHSSGHLLSLAALHSGGTALLQKHPGFDAAEAIRIIHEEAINATMLVPSMLYQILDHPDCPRDGFPDLRSIAYGAAPANPERLRQALERFGPVLYQGYGQTEMGRITYLSHDEHDVNRPQLLASAGRPAADVELEIRDPAGAALPAGAVGEIFARGSTMMAGYWNDPERTAETLVNGWLRTGDLGYRDIEGYVYLVDRAKDIIVTAQAGDNVYSRLLDDFAATLPGVAHAAAVGIPVADGGEAVHLFLVNDGPTLAEDRMRELIVAEHGEIYAPSAITSVSALPLTPIGKVDKKALRALVAAERTTAQT